jgi:hypothetical protein
LREDSDNEDAGQFSRDASQRDPPVRVVGKSSFALNDPVFTRTLNKLLLLPEMPQLSTAPLLEQH